MVLYRSIVPLLAAIAVVCRCALGCDQQFILTASWQAASAKAMFTLVSQLPLDSLIECITKCQTSGRLCDAVRFDRADVKSADDSGPNTSPAVCTLLRHSTDGNETLVNQNTMYYAGALCLPDEKHVDKGGEKFDKQETKAAGCPPGHWAFERFEQLRPSHLDVSSQDASRQALFTGLHVAATVEECLAKCIHTDRFNGKCRAAAYAAHTGHCRLLDYGPSSVRQVTYLRIINTYPFVKTSPQPIETTHTANLSSRKCDFMPARHAGLFGVFDERMGDVPDALHCKQLCLEFSAPLCRSYTYDGESRQCYLSHRSSKTVPTYAVERSGKGRDMVQMADLDDCIDFSLRCTHDAMLVRGRSLQLLSATISSKYEADEKMRRTTGECGVKIDDKYEFLARFSYDHCGTRSSKDLRSAYYTNLLYLKDAATELVTIRDKLVQTTCKITRSDEQIVSYRFGVLGNDTDDNPLNAALNDASRRGGHRKGVPAGAYALEIVDVYGQPLEEITAGQNGFITVDAEAGTELQVTDVVAVDDTGEVIMQLYDEDGPSPSEKVHSLNTRSCPTNPEFIKPLKRNSADGRLRAKITFPQIDADRTVVFKALVRPCPFGCPVVELYGVASRPTTLTHKSTEAIENSFVVDGKRYVAHTNRVIRLPQLMSLLTPAANGEGPDSKRQSGHESREDVPSFCSQHKTSCIMTAAIGALHVTLLGTCLIMLYFYLKELRYLTWRRRAAPTINTITTQQAQINSASERVQYTFRPPPDYDTVCPTSGGNGNESSGDSSSGKVAGMPGLDARREDRGIDH